MDFDGFDWDAGNLEKSKKHGLKIDAIESFFSQELLIVSDGKHSSKEQRFIAAGISEKGRPMLVAYTWRNQLIRVISARFMHAKESKAYEKLKKNIKQK
ncbi:MAG: BrnT family toxin [Deltaproteobacteria bacterium]|nr:BrnT family toxin [Deltaproteobacteria bacterium]